MSMLVTFLLLLLSGVVYPIVGYYVAEDLVPDVEGTGANVPAIVVLFAAPIALSIATAALAGRRRRTCLWMGFVSAIGVIAVTIAVIVALAHSGLFE